MYGRLEISLEAGVGNIELMITVMDMETSYVIVVYSNHISFTTSVLTGLQPSLLSSDKFELIRSQMM